MTTVERAMLFCKVAHNAVGQQRKYNGLPYWTHPFAVMEIVASVPHTESQLVAALLHDVVEDTEITVSHVAHEFGDKVADMVNWLTDRSTPEMGNRAVRKTFDRNRIAMAPPAVQTIKLADLIDNSKSIVNDDPKFAPVYMNEMKQLLSVLNKGDATLHAKAQQIVDNFFS